MALTLAEIEIAARKLSVDDRMLLAEKLMISVHSETDPEVEKAWAREAERRMQGIENGKVKTRDGYEVLKEARALNAAISNPS